MEWMEQAPVPPPNTKNNLLNIDLRWRTYQRQSPALGSPPTWSRGTRQCLAVIFSLKREASAGSPSPSSVPCLLPRLVRAGGAGRAAAAALATPQDPAAASPRTGASLPPRAAHRPAATMRHRNQLQHYKKSTFPPLLNTYQALPGRTEGDENQKQMIKDKKRRKSNNQPTLHEVDKEEVMKQALLEQRHHEMYKNLQKLKNAMYAHHKDLLNKKVQEQRIKIQMSDLRFKQILEHQKRKKIIGLQNELIRQGILKNQQDYEDFWTLILEGSHNIQLKEKLQAVKSKMIALKSSPSHVHGRSSATELTKALLNKHYGQLKKNPEAVLGSASRQPPIHHPSKHMKPQEETEQIFPKTKTWKRNRKHYEHERRLIYLHHMYYLALINMKSSKRLLEKNGQFAMTEQQYDVCDLMDYLFPNRHKQPGTSPTERERRENVLPVLMRKKQQEQHHRGPSKISRVFKGLRNGSERKQDEDRGVIEVLKDQKSIAHVLPETIPVPLTLEDVVLKNRVVEAKSAVTYWINYADKEAALS